MAAITSFTLKCLNPRKMFKWYILEIFRAKFNQNGQAIWAVAPTHTGRQTDRQTDALTYARTYAYTHIHTP